MRRRKQSVSPLGSSFENVLVASGLHDDVTEYAVKAVFAWQLDERRKAKGLTKKQFADLLGTSRSQLDRVVDPDNEGVTIETLKKAARVPGKKVHLELVDNDEDVRA
jgi:hypothetical protein